MTHFTNLHDCGPEDLEEKGAGGKAIGLARLSKLGLLTPPGLVLTDLSTKPQFEDLQEQLKPLAPGPYAVRSSAEGEDGAEASFAGQYTSLLNVDSVEGVMRAIEECENSLFSQRAQAYREEQANLSANTMSVVIQRMVPAKVAGVLFSADPVTGRRDHLVVDAVRGLGESLVSGTQTPDHFLTTREGETIHQDLVGDAPILKDQHIRELVKQARKVEAAWGLPLDFEWAIDERGVIWWLQARPITNLPIDPRELDTVVQKNTDVFTRYNIGEMMPGAVTPLTLSITARGIDVGLQAMMKACGVQKKIENENLFVGTFFNHLFLNLTALAVITTAVAGSTTERMGQALCGRAIDEVDPGPPLSLWRQILNGIRYGLYILGSNRAAKRLVETLEAVPPLPAGTSVELWPWLEQEIKRLEDIYCLHLQTSAASGALTPALLEIVAEGQAPTEEHHAVVASWIRVDEGVESASIATDMEAMLTLLARDPNLAAQLKSKGDEDAFAWLNDTASGKLGELWQAYLQKHGHRVVRELELHEREWESDPRPLLKTLRQHPNTPPPQFSSNNTPVARQPRGAVKWMVQKNRHFVRVREKTKSQLAKMTTHLKKGFRELGHRLVTEGVLEDVNLVFFLQRDEIQRMLHTKSQSWNELAKNRQVAFEYQQELRFEDLFIGAATPRVMKTHVDTSRDCLKGKPVSRGYVEGPARVVRHLSEALEVQPGEILIAPVTDVGWTPCFGVIAGVVTEIGSAVSHGAVVAREYGLPGLVNVSGATEQFKTGEMVVLDADRGLVYRKGYVVSST